MSHHEQYSVDPSQRDKPFVAYPSDFARPTVYAPRNQYGPDGRVMQDATGAPITQPEAGWIPEGVLTVGGVEYTRIQKLVLDPATGQYSSLQKDVETTKLLRLQEKMYEEERERRDREMGHGAVALVRSAPEDVLQRAPNQPPVRPRVDPSEWALTPAQAEDLRRELADHEAGVRERIERATKRDPNGVITGFDFDQLSDAGPAVAESAPATPERTASELIDELTAGLSAKDKGHLDRYSRYLHYKRVAQKEGDGNGSTTNGQYAGQEHREMSQAAKDVASRYQDLWDRVKE